MRALVIVRIVARPGPAAFESPSCGAALQVRFDLLPQRNKRGRMLPLEFVPQRLPYELALGYASLAGALDQGAIEFRLDTDLFAYHACHDGPSALLRIDLGVTLARDVYHMCNTGAKAVPGPVSRAESPQRAEPPTRACAEYEYATPYPHDLPATPRRTSARCWSMVRSAAATNDPVALATLASRAKVPVYACERPPP